jgi:tetratricopeptide (TPR) repeat protein
MRKIVKIISIIFGSIVGIILIGFGFYVYLYYPRIAEPFEIIPDNPKKKILIATQSSEFKDRLVEDLCDSLQNSSTHIKGIDSGDLSEVNAGDWDRILIINAFLIEPSSDVTDFINRSNNPNKSLLLETSGGADWLPEPELKIDALTSASRKEYITGLVQLILDWLGKEGHSPWKPDDYLLALKFFPRVDVTRACSAIKNEQARYRKIYPDLERLINRIGYDFLRLEKTDSAEDVFKLNVDLFPQSWNVYDSYGEALFLNGNLNQAIRNYRRALELNPDSESSKNMLDLLL